MKGEEGEQLVKLAFITGFPDSISIELQQIQGVDSMSVGEIIPRARILAGNVSGRSGGVAAPVVGQGGPGSSGGSSGGTGKGPVKCFLCRGPHLVKNYPDRQRELIKSFKCGGTMLCCFARKVSQ